ncbi:MAG: helix-turn-helix domain-containing protein [Planctomycetota bacterium]
MDEHRANAPQPPKLALRANEAAQALGVSRRKLWELTNRGVIPHVRVGRSILYPISALNDWLGEHSKEGTSI